MKGLTYLNLILIVYLLLITEYTLPSGSCQPSDETHRGCPRRAPGASRGTARENRGPWRAWEAGCPVRARAERTPTEPWEAGAWARGAQVLLRLPRRSSNGSGTGPERPDANPIARPPPAHRGTSRVRARLFIPPWIQTLHHTQDDPSDAAGVPAPAAPSGALMRRPPGSRPPAGSPGWGCRRAG